MLLDRKSTRLNSSHTIISYAVFCLKKKKKNNDITYTLVGAPVLALRSPSHIVAADTAGGYASRFIRDEANGMFFFFFFFLKNGPPPKFPLFPPPPPLRS